MTMGFGFIFANSLSGGGKHIGHTESDLLYRKVKNVTSNSILDVNNNLNVLNVI